MSDIPTFEPDSDDMPDDGAVELALRLAPPQSWEMCFALVKIAVDPRTTKRNLRALHDALSATTVARQQLETDRTTFATYEQKTRAELEQQAAKLREGQVELANKKEDREDRLAEREQRISALERQWRFIGEDNVADVERGFRAAEFSSLMKARAAYGITRDDNGGLDSVAQQMRERFPPTRNVRTDPQGVDFPAHTSLSRGEPEPAPTGAVRIRGRKNSAPEVRHE
jgi:hypothetical protein